MPAPSAWTALLDDASVLPPRGLALDDALEAHTGVRRGRLGEVVGALVVTERELPSLGSPDPVVHLRVTGGAGMLEAALRSLGTLDPGVERVGIALRDEADLAHNARRVVQVLDSLGDALADDLAVHVALPALGPGPTAGWLAALDELATRELGVLVPHRGAGDPTSSRGTAEAVEAALDRELPLGFEGGGLDVALTAWHAVRVALDGGGVDGVAEALADPAGALLWAVEDAEGATRTRRWCRSIAVPDVATAVVEAERVLG